MTEAEREARSIAISVKCGMLPLVEGMEMAEETGCKKELEEELGIKWEIAAHAEEKS